jgi:hypothetical protein
MGTLAVLYYVNEPRTYYCPDQTRFKNHHGASGLYHLADSGRDPYWNDLTGRDAAGQDHDVVIDPTGHNHTHKGGYSHYFYVFDSGGDSTVKVDNNYPYSGTDHPPSSEHPYSHGKVRRLSFGDIASRYDRAQYTPLILSCAQEVAASWTYPSESHLDPSTGEPSGVNGAFYDGSVRWISRNEILNLAAQSTEPEILDQYADPAQHKFLLQNGHHHRNEGVFEFIARNELRISGN